MTAKLEALRALLDEAILDSRRRLDDSRDLDRSYSSNSSKSKSGFSSVFNTENVLNYNSNDNDNSLLHDEEAIYWKKRCMAMQTTQHNRDPLLSNVENELKQAQEREDHAALLVKSLEDKIAELDASGNRSKSASCTSSHDHNDTLRRELVTKMETRRKLLAFMEWLTSTSIQKKRNSNDNNEEDENNEEYVCTVKNKVDKIASRFSVVPILDEDELLHRHKSIGKEIDSSNDGIDNEGPPMRFIPRANVQHLPAYLRDSMVEVERNMAPVLMSDVLKCMFLDDEEKQEDKA